MSYKIVAMPGLTGAPAPGGGLRKAADVVRGRDLAVRTDLLPAVRVEGGALSARRGRFGRWLLVWATLAVS